MVVITVCMKFLIPYVMLQTIRQQNIWSSRNFGVIFGLFALNIVILYWREILLRVENIERLHQVLRSYHRMSYVAMNRHGTLSIVERLFSFVDTNYFAITGGFNILISATISIAIALVFGFSLNREIGLLWTLAIPINYAGFRWINRELSRRMSLFHQSNAKSKQNMLSILQSSDFVKSQSAYNDYSAIFQEGIQMMYTSLKKVNQFAQASSQTIGFINQIIQLVTYVMLATFSTNRSDKLEQLVLTSVILPVFFSSMSDLTRSQLELSAWRVDKQYIQDSVLNVAEEQGAYASKSVMEISFDNPSVILDNNVKSYKVQSTYRKGDWVYVHGASGVGKSTLLKAIIGLYESQGIAVNGHSVNQWDRAVLRQRIHYQSQVPVIFNATLAMNLNYGKELTTSQCRLIEQSRFLETLESKDYSQEIYVEGANLSGGQMQRIAFVRTLLTDADVLILDEPCSQLDDESAFCLLRTLQSLTKGKLVFFVSHNPEHKQLANKEIHIV